MSKLTFKQRTRSEIVKSAADYKAVFIDYDYLIFSEDFKIKPYYIISANADNYPHLTGVNSLLPSAQTFFDKCIDGSLEESDFDFASKNRSESDVKGPKTLLQSNELDTASAVLVQLVLRRSRGADKFDTVVQGDVAKFCELFPDYQEWF
ncbi:MAG: PBECR4 domain-containing protein [Defluviitaleaceae bacterium]|nr:PBECR4 domain-containing protein [Defluviitaleaceae bacterium]